MNIIDENIRNIRKEIEIAANKSGRKSEDVLLLAVTKTVDTDKMIEALGSNITAVGENKPQELNRKYKIIGEKVKWHQIGSLQTNKVKYIIDKADLIHSLDREVLCEEIQKRAIILDREINCLVQVNVSGEDSKHGVDFENAIDFIKLISRKYNKIKVLGLMTMAPFDANEEEIRLVFRNLKKLSLEIETLNLTNVKMKELSMGMSGDYKIAIEEGATIVRVGTSIFGKRDYK